MKVGLFSSKPYDQRYFERITDVRDKESQQLIGIQYFDASLNINTAVLAKGLDAVCVFVNDILDTACLTSLHDSGIRHIALRCAGFNNVDLRTAERLGMTVSRVPAYSPEAVAEHTLALILTLNRNIHRAYNRVKDNNFSLIGLEGFTVHGKTVGVIGTGKIGQVVCRILQGFGCRVYAYDPEPDPQIKASGCHYVEFDELLRISDIITLHCPLTRKNQHMIDSVAINKMKDGVMVVNTSRGALLDSKALIEGLKRRKIGYLALDVYELESELFFQDHSCEIVQDDVFDRLAGFPNVLITGHQGFFTREALTEIAACTLNNLQRAASGDFDSYHFLVSPRSSTIA